ncbi:MAG: threonylcarbamoyl-AMP synthase [Firmicutes bacterium]|nr:threonylcarbamoyl-AMP synthase [Bacillota bacterium]
MRKNTEVVRLDPRHPDRDLISRAAETIRRGGLVAFPTETVYGLGADGMSAEAVANLFRAKGRPPSNPLTLHVWAVDEVRCIVREVPPAASLMMERFWPGPLTLILPRGRGIPDVTTAGLDSVGVRMPDHPVALSVIEAAGRPLAVPSANLSGRPSPTCAAHVLEDLDGLVDMVLDAGPAGLGIESTVLDLTAVPPVIRRPGAIAAPELVALIGDIVLDSPESAPGAGSGLGATRRFEHYVPAVPAILVRGTAAEVSRALVSLCEGYREKGKKVGVVASSETAPLLTSAVVRVAGSRRTLESIAKGFFGCLRDLEEAAVDVVLLEGVDDTGLGQAIMDRMAQAARGNVLDAREIAGGCGLPGNRSSPP